MKNGNKIGRQKAKIYNLANYPTFSIFSILDAI